MLLSLLCQARLWLHVIITAFCSVRHSHICYVGERLVQRGFVT